MKNSKYTGRRFVLFLPSDKHNMGYTIAVCSQQQLMLPLSLAPCTFAAFHYTELQVAQDIKGSHLMCVIYMLLFPRSVLGVIVPPPDCCVSMEGEVNLLLRGLVTGCAGNESNLASLPPLHDYSLCIVSGIFHLLSPPSCVCVCVSIHV